MADPEAPPSPPGTLLLVTLQERFLQRSHQQLAALLGDRLDIRPVSLNELTAAPPQPEETILYFAAGVRTMVERLFPGCGPFFQAGREICMWNLRELFLLEPGQHILVVNDSRANTEEMLRDLLALGLQQHFVGYFPGERVPEDIDCIVTSGEQGIIPAELRHLPVIDCGLRVVSLETIFRLCRHFSLPFDPAILARKYQQAMVTLAERWPRPDDELFITPWFGTVRDRTARATFADFIANSATMGKFVQHAAKLAATDRPVHVYGAIGTGKKLICQAIHNGSTRRGGPFLTVNCAAGDQAGLERLLFGRQNGDTVRRGLLDEAHGGTLCIEEVGALEPRLQAKLLQVLTEGLSSRVGGSEMLPIDARIVTTSSTQLELDESRPMDSNLFLFLSRYTCRVPSLDERGEDFEPLIRRYLVRHLQRAATDIDPAAIEALRGHRWKGNVQELYNVLQYMACTGDGPLSCEELPYYIISRHGPAPSSHHGQAGATGADDDLLDLCRDIERHGFLGESLAILEAFRDGKRHNIAYGRAPMQEVLRGRGLRLTEQQLRLRLAKLRARGLLHVRPGRSGTTISSRGEAFLDAAQHWQKQPSTLGRP